MRDWLKRRLRGPGKAPSAVKAPVKVTVKARIVRADGSLGDEIEVKNIEVTRG